MRALNHSLSLGDRERETFFTMPRLAGGCLNLGPLILGKPSWPHCDPSHLLCHPWFNRKGEWRPCYAFMYTNVWHPNLIQPLLIPWLYEIHSTWTVSPIGGKGKGWYSQVRGFHCTQYKDESSKGTSNTNLAAAGRWSPVNWVISMETPVKESFLPS